MKLEQSFEVDAPLDRVWEALVDVERVAPCLPGAAVTGRNDDGTYNGTFTIKIGPTTASYTGKLEMQKIDESAHVATMHAQGSDKRGQGGATATIVSTLSARNGGTQVQVVTDYHITGRLARFGRGGMIEVISERLLREFAGRLQSSLAGGGGAAASSPAPSGVVSAVAAPSDAPGDEDEAPTAVHEVVRPLPETPAEDEAPSPPTPAEDEAPSPPPTEIAAAAAPPAPEPQPPAPPEAPPPSPPPAGQAPPPAAASGPPAAPPSPPAAAPPPPPPPSPQAESAPPLEAGPLVGGVLLSRIKKNPKPLIAVAGGLVLLRVLRRRH